MNPGKAELRRAFRLRRSKLPEDDRGVMSRTLCAVAAVQPLFRAAEAVGIYAPVGSEVDLTPLTALAPGKVWCWPRITGNGTMVFAAADMGELVPGRFGIPAPGEKLPERVPDLLLVPCLAVDRCGYRLGQGGGYYDRYLAAHAVTAWAAAYPCQVVGRLPRDTLDIPVGGILTPEAFLEAEDEI